MLYLLHDRIFLQHIPVIKSDEISEDMRKFLRLSQICYQADKEISENVVLSCIGNCTVINKFNELNLFIFSSSITECV